MTKTLRYAAAYVEGREQNKTQRVCKILRQSRFVQQCSQRFCASFFLCFTVLQEEKVIRQTGTLSSFVEVQFQGTR